MNKDTISSEHVELVARERQKIHAWLEKNHLSPVAIPENAHINDFDKPFSKFFEHTALKADLRRQDIVKLCEESRKLQTAAVCLPPNWVATASELLSGSDVRLCSVIGFPLGYSVAASKAAEVTALQQYGCDEFDVVISIGKLLDEDFSHVFSDLSSVVGAADGKIVKVILETALLDPVHIVQGSILAIAAGASYLKTSTGFSTEGATVENIRLMRHIAGSRVGVKAAGGVRTIDFAREVIAAGADRVGCSRTAEVLSSA